MRWRICVRRCRRTSPVVWRPRWCPRAECVAAGSVLRSFRSSSNSRCVLLDAACPGLCGCQYRGAEYVPIYQAIYMVPRGELRTELIGELRRSHTKRMPRARGTSRKGGNIANLVPLSERPAEVDARLVPGHWEGDFIKGARNASAIGTAVERHSRFVLLTQMNGCTATHALDGFTRRFNGVIPELRRSFTYDRGSEMARHLELTEATGMPVFFCEPYSPWQRGSNENMNGLVRQFLPKGTDLSTVTPQKLAYIESMLNDRPRKILGFRTPREVYTELVQTKLAQRQALAAKTVALQT
ncbi:IS30 family transposase [Sphaerotilus sp.]|uniref:IS30 family transposase n=1 Tax=Sphaerotilus sp. TaxID=2093942 RepID=UPI002ACEFF0C|nr:IS30 family transposase [Sphaerotilus sp.]MDZ7857355.1 IS30 family transposase [Sphaerotilus sp.]